MQKNVNRLLIYKSDGSTIVDVSNNLENLTFNGGSVQETGDGIVDNSSYTLGFSLKNTNEMQFSPHFEKGKYVFNYNYNLVLNGAQEYNLPFENIVEVVSLTEGYHAQLLNKKIYIDSWGLPLSGTIKLGITYIDTTVNNPLNFIGTEYAPLLKNGNRVSWYKDKLNTTFEDYFIQGNGTDEIILYNTYNLNDILLTGAKVIINPVNYYEVCQENYYLKCKENYYKLSYNGTDDNVYLGNDFFRLSLLNYYDLSQENYKELCDLSHDDTLEIISTNKVGNALTVKFNRTITNNEWLFISASWDEVISSYLKFDGYINQDPQSDIESVSVNCIDRAMDLQNETGLTYQSFRTYDTIKLTDTTFETVEQVTKAYLTNNVATSSYLDYTQLFTLGQSVRVKVGSNYVNCTISALTQNSFTLNSGAVTIPNGKYPIFKVWPQGIPLPNFLQNCLDDRGLGYTVYDLEADTFNIVPKADEMEYDDLWNMFQSYVVKTANILSFENINGNFELCLRNIPLEFSTPKYEITSDDIWDEKTHWLASTDIRTSWKLKYQLLKDGKYTETTIVKDDFIESLNAVTVLTEGNIINTDELLVVNDFVRINNEYYKVLEALTSSVYKLNKEVIEATSYTLYTQGQYTNANGLKQASIELDNTSAIDTEEEANKFTDLLLYQTKEPYSIYKVALNADNYDLFNFDTIKVTCPEFSLYNENVFVQSIEESYNSGNNKVSITFSKKQQLGKNKFKEMITERGLNQVVSSKKINTTDVFPPPQNLVALDPSIDDLNNYVVYSRVSWNDLIGRQVAQWELQYSTDENFTTYETLTLNTTELKLVLKEQKMYYIRVRGVSKEQVKGEWANTTVDASKYLIENPIQNNTWYIRLFEGNDEEEYFNIFDKLNYSLDFMNKYVKHIEIIPNEVFLNPNKEIIWNKKTQLNQSLGLEQLIYQRVGSNKNLFFNTVNDCVYLIEDYNRNNPINSFSLDLFGDVIGNGKATFKLLNTIKGFYYTGVFSDVKRNIKNLHIIHYINFNNSLSSTSTTVGIDGDNKFEDSNIFENITYEKKNIHSSWTNVIGFRYLKNVDNCVSLNATKGFSGCRKMNKNLTINCNVKYESCYASSDTSVPIPTTGSDTAQYGWNT